MNDLEKRLAALSPEKRRLLERRLGRSKTAEHPTEEDGPRPGLSGRRTSRPPRPLEFSLFFFSADGSAEDPGAGRYHFLLECARQADSLGFSAVWTPERHFQDFGGLYPNPSILSAALAVHTERLQIRAGSLVLPLHHPVRVAEDWAVIDNLSGGRAALSLATGWHPADFVIRPEAYAERKDALYRDLDILRRLWRGEALTMPGGDGEAYEVRTLPQPVQASLPIWITSSGSAETWKRAGEAGANILSSLAAQPFEDLERKIEAYRRAREEAGHAGSGVVSLMLHAFLGDDIAEVKHRVREPLSDYLRTHLKQRDSFLQLPAITEADKEALIPMAFEHYVNSASLVGTAESCAAILDDLSAIGVDDIACLCDFGLDLESTQASLERLDALRRQHASKAGQEIPG